MTETKERDRKTSRRLSRPGRLELSKTVEAGQVRQSFSHGRSKQVTVEVKKRRTFARAEGGRMQEVKLPPATEPEAEEAPRRDAAMAGSIDTLTAEERAARKRALKTAVNSAGEDVAVAPPSEAGESVEPSAPTTPSEVEAPARDSQLREVDAEARRLAEEQVAVKLTESKIRPQTPVRPAPAPRPAAPSRPASAPAEEPKRGRRGRPEQPRRPSAGLKRGEPRRRGGGKMSITEALNDDGSERVRSLTSVRRAREREKEAAREALKESKKVIRDVVIPETITVQELANRMAERGADVIKALMNMGVMATINQTIDADTAELVVEEFGHKVKRTAEADVEIGIDGAPDAPESLEPRAPVVTVMGHVDHGKTSLLDALRQTDVVSREAGGITQHIGAYQVELSSGAKITFLDTPGHEAFTAMRARGAAATDIVVLVVAADDGIRPQTIEAIAHARAAEVPMIVAINKIDRRDADPQRVRTELLQYEVVPEEMGGDVICIDVSATEKTNLDKLEEAILLQAEFLELKANRSRPAHGVVIEAKLERGRGPVATVLVQRGTLKIGDVFIAGAEWGRVRALINDRGEQVPGAYPSEPVEVLGLNGSPAAGDDFAVIESEARAREITEFRARRLKKASSAVSAGGGTADIWTQVAKGDVKEVRLVVKADVQGSVEAIVGATLKLANDEVSVRILHSGVGGINESDIGLAKASQALVVGFNVRANPQAQQLARKENLDIRYYSVIYDIVDDIKAMLSGLLEPTLRERFLGNAEIREVFNITKVGKVAGCRVTNGVVKRGARVRLLRDDTVIHEGRLGTLKRFKEEVREVKEGYECGMAFENYNDIKVGDVIECFEVEEVARTLE